MGEEINELLREISEKLDQLIVLARLEKMDAIKRLSEKVRKNPVLSKIVELSKENLSSSELKRKVAQATRKSEPRVEQCIYKLVDDGVLVPVRKGREIYYKNSGLLR
jgi:DNA-binding protein H-NS